MKIRTPLPGGLVGGCVAIIVGATPAFVLAEKSESKAPAVASSKNLVLRTLSRFALLPNQLLGGDFVESIIGTEVGERITIPLQSSVEAILTLNHETSSGVRTIVGTLDGFADAKLAITIESDGSISGNVMNSSDHVALKISRSAGARDLAVETVTIDQIICSRGAEGHGLESEPAEGQEADPVAASATGQPSEGPMAAIPVLNSKEGAARVIYLDFDGEVVENTWWKNGARINAQPYAQQGNISGIWARIAEDFAPFNVNVTTSRAVFDAADSSRRCMVIFTPTNDAAPGAGGVAYLNTFGHSVTYMSWVFNSGVDNAAEAGSHEAGHQLGLKHDGTGSQGYYSGHTHSASGVQWGPIMGASYNRHITQWSKGEYSGADNSEDDMSLITKYLPYRSDDHANSTFLATVVSTDDPGTFFHDGMIENASDVDYFKITTDQVGAISITATPSANYRNLDIQLSLLNSGGSVLTSANPQNSFGATVGLGSAPVGTYYLKVEGAGLGAGEFAENGYNKYGSVGPYSLSGNFPSSHNAPSPPANVSASDGGGLFNRLSVEWDEVDGANEYEIYRGPSSDPAEAVSMGTSTSAYFVDDAATQGNIYFYFVRAISGSTRSAHSEPDTGYTGSLVLQAPRDVVASDSSSTEYVRISWLEAAYATSYYIYRNTTDSAGGDFLGVTSDLVYFDSSADVGTTYYYSVTAAKGSKTSARSQRDAGTRAEELSPPSAPANVVASRGSSENYVVIQWSGSSGAEHYHVYRSESSHPGSSVRISGSQGTIETFFYDTDARAGATYYYFVKASNSAGSSGFSSGAVGYRTQVVTNDDRYENNDELGSAYDLRSAEERWLRSVAGYGIARNDDWFSVQLAPNESRVEVILSFPSRSGDIDLGVYDDSGVLLADSVSTTPNETIAFETGRPGAFLYVRVFPKTDAAGSYDLKWKSQPSGRPGNLADMAIGRTMSSLDGADLYSASGGGQTIVSKQKGRRKHSASLSVENEGAVGAGVSVVGNASNRKFKLIYFHAGANVTAAVKTGSPLSLRALEEQYLSVVAKPKSRKSTKKQKATVWTKSRVGSNSPDLVTIKLTTKGKRKR